MQQLRLILEIKFPMKLKNIHTVHTKRSLVSKLYALKSNKKFPGCSQLSVKVIGYLGKCFGYCVAQHKNNPQALQIAIQNIVPHAFGKHQNCDDVWCQQTINIMTYLLEKICTVMNLRKH